VVFSCVCVCVRVCACVCGSGFLTTTGVPLVVSMCVRVCVCVRVHVCVSGFLTTTGVKLWYLFVRVCLILYLHCSKLPTKQSQMMCLLDHICAERPESCVHQLASNLLVRCLNGHLWLQCRRITVFGTNIYLHRVTEKQISLYVLTGTYAEPPKPCFQNHQQIGLSHALCATSVEQTQ